MINTEGTTGLGRAGTGIFESTGAKHQEMLQLNPETHSFSSSLCSFSWWKRHSWLAVLLCSLSQRDFPKCAMDFCGEADWAVRSRKSSKKLPEGSLSLLLWLLNLTCLKICQCTFNFPLNYGTSKISCFLVILILNESLFTRKFAWNLSICFKALVDTRTQTESMITSALLPPDYQIPFPVLHPVGSASCLWCSHL